MTKTQESIDADFEWTYFDGFQMSLWFVALYVFCSQLGFWWGLAFYTVLYYGFSALMESQFGLEAMTGGDCIFFVDDARNYTNIISFLKFDKIKDVSNFKKLMMERSMKFSRLRSCVVKRYGRYWFQDLGKEHYKTQCLAYIIEKTGIHNEAQLAEFLEKEQSYREKLDSY